MVSRQPHVVACIQLNNRLPSRIVSFATAREIRKGEQACERQDTIALNAPSTRHSIASEGCPNSGAGAIRSGIAIFFFFFRLSLLAGNSAFAHLVIWKRYDLIWLCGSDPIVTNGRHSLALRSCEWNYIICHIM